MTFCLYIFQRVIRFFIQPLKTLLDSDWIKRIAFFMLHKGKLQWRFQKSAWRQSKNTDHPRYFKGKKNSPKAFQRWPKLITCFPSTSENQAKCSKDQRLSPEYFWTPLRITQNPSKDCQKFAKIADYHLKLAKDFWRLLEVFWIFQEI